MTYPADTSPSQQVKTRAAVEEDEGLLREIGRVVVLWAMLNNLISEIPRQNGDDAADEEFFSKGTDLNRLERALAVIRKTGGHAHRADELTEALSIVKGLIPERNLIIHGSPGRTIERTTGKRISIVRDRRDVQSNASGQAFADLIEKHITQLRTGIGIIFEIITDPVWIDLRRHETGRREQSEHNMPHHARL